MQQTDNTRRTSHLFGKITKNKRNLTILIGALIILVVFLIIVAAASGGKSGRSESYKDVSGAAGLNASITYDCRTDCGQKFSFNIYILKDDGQQVAVVRPDKNGKVNMALPEGNYIMLIGKQIGKDKLFPQEPIALKNGKELELKLHYKEGAL